MTALKTMVGGIDHLNRCIGFIIKWLLLATTILSASNAITRKAFDLSSNGMLEAQWYLYAAVFLLGGGYAFLHNSHIRIDFVSTRLGARGRNLVDIAGIVVVLIPFCIFVINLSWGFFTAAWHSGEMSGNAGGLVRWPAYLLIPAGFSLLLLQGMAELVKRILFLTGKGPDCIAEDNAQDTPIHVPAEALSTAQEGAR